MLQTWNPWQELENVQRRLGRAVRSDDGSNSGVSWASATDVVEDGEGLYLDLPDVDEGSLAVETEQNTLSVKATRRYRQG